MRLPSITSLLLFAPLLAEAAPPQRDRCRAMMRDGWYKRYEFNNLKDSIRKYKPVSGTTRWSTEPTTAILDPLYLWHATTSGAHTTSSWGDCRLVQLELFHRRERYFTQNKGEILHEIAKGKGEHLQVLAAFTDCGEAAHSRFGSGLQKKMRAFLELPAEKPLGAVIDQALQEDEELRTQCAPLS